MMRDRGAYAGVMMALIVTLEVFSGRPNPEWTLTPADSAEFERQLAALAPLAPAPAAPEQPLGYSGFSVRGRATPVQVFQGVVVNGAQALADPGRGLEHWLLNTGRGLLDPGLATYVDSEIASGP